MEDANAEGHPAQQQVRCADIADVLDSLTGKIRLQLQYQGQHLSLMSCIPKPQGLELVCKIAADYPQCHSLDVRKNRLEGAQDGEALAKLVNLHRNITKIDLSWNRIGSYESITPICESMSSSLCTIIHLDLRHNGIDEVCARSIAKMLPKNRSLRTLDLRWNNVSIDGSKELCIGLLNNETLEYLKLTGNNCPNSILLVIDKYCIRNRRLNEDSRFDSTTDVEYEDELAVSDGDVHASPETSLDSDSARHIANLRALLAFENEERDRLQHQNNALEMRTRHLAQSVADANKYKNECALRLVNAHAETERRLSLMTKRLHQQEIDHALNVHSLQAKLLQQIESSADEKDHLKSQSENWRECYEALLKESDHLSEKKMEGLQLQLTQLQKLYRDTKAELMESNKWVDELRVQQKQSSQAEHFAHVLETRVKSLLVQLEACENLKDDAFKQQQTTMNSIESLKKAHEWQTRELEGKLSQVQNEKDNKSHENKLLQSTIRTLQNELQEKQVQLSECQSELSKTKDQLENSRASLELISRAEQRAAKHDSDDIGLRENHYEFTRGQRKGYSEGFSVALKQSSLCETGRTIQEILEWDNPC